MDVTICGENNLCGESGAFGAFYCIKNSPILTSAIVCGSSSDKPFLDAIRKLVESKISKVDDAINEFKSHGYSM